MPEKMDDPEVDEASAGDLWLFSQFSGSTGTIKAAFDNVTSASEGVSLWSKGIDPGGCLSDALLNSLLNFQHFERVATAILSKADGQPGSLFTVKCNEFALSNPELCDALNGVNLATAFVEFHKNTLTNERSLTAADLCRLFQLLVRWSLLWFGAVDQILRPVGEWRGIIAGDSGLCAKVFDFCEDIAPQRERAGWTIREFSALLSQIAEHRPGEMVFGSGEVKWEEPFDKFAIPEGDGQMYQTMIAIARIAKDPTRARTWLEEQVQKFRWRPGGADWIEKEVDEIVENARNPP
jgi:hypothetical protein